MADRGLVKSEVALRVIEGIGTYKTLGDACKAEGITQQTFWAWRRDDPELARATQRALDDALREDIVDVHLAGRQIKGDPEAYLKYYAGHAIRLAQRRLPEYRQEQAAPTGIVLNMYLSALVAPVESGPEPIDVTPRVTELPESSGQDQD